MADKIKCSYEGCFKRFSSREAMIKHKVKEPEHEYCKRCDVDCDDDLEYLIHQMNNPKHIACCICGLEFKSNAGRDAHVEQRHPRDQDIECPGCKEKFTKAGVMMRHIENDECSVISSEIYQRKRAEKQIEKDAWAEALDPSKGSCLPSTVATATDADSNTGGVSLLDNDHSYSSAYWQGAMPQSSGPDPLQPIIMDGQYRAQKPLIESTGLLSLDKFPSLPAQDTKASTQKQTENSSTVTSEDDNDLLSFDQVETIIRSPTGPWAATTAAKALFSSTRSQPPRTFDTDITSSADTSSSISTSTVSDPPLSMFDRLSRVSLAAQPSTVPPAARPTNTDPNAPHVTVRTAPSIAPPSKLDPYSYFDSLQNVFVCPGAKCGRKYNSPEDFRDHLLTGAHAGGRTTCPSCLRHFNTTAALISHCESPSLKCKIRKSANYNQVMRELTGGMIGTEGHLVDGSVKYVVNHPQNW